MTNQLQTLDQIRSTAIDLGMNFGPRLIVAVLIITAGLFTARWVVRLFSQQLSRFQLEPPVRLLLARIVRLIVMGLFVILALQNLGVELLPLIAGLGVAGAGVALAMQGVLGNLMAGLTIIFTRPFRVGEYVSMLGVEGQVEVIDLFTTRLSHPDRSRVIVPNRKIVGEILHNYGSIRQLDLVIGVTYDSDLNRVLAVVREVLGRNPRILKDPAPVMGVSTMADSSIDIAVKPWVNVPDLVPASAEVYQALIEAFREKGVEVPFPQHEVRILNDRAA